MSIFDWFKRHHAIFTADDLKQILDEVKQFNAGAIDPALSRYIDAILDKWLKEK